MRHWLPALALMATVTLCGCAGMVDSVSDFMRAGPWWTAAQAGTISSRARELEAHGELSKALDHWRMVDRITVDHAAVRREIARIQSRIAEAVNVHYQNGLAELGKKNQTAARNHFLAALRLDPAFQPALIQINARFSTFPLAARLSAPGDRPSTVAEKVFDDKEKAFLVAWFNDLPVDEVMTPDTLLILPKLEKTPPQKAHTKKPPNRLAEANARLAENDLDGALAIVEQADPDDPDVKAMLHAIRLKQATTQIEAGRPEAARPYLAMVPDGFAGKDAALEALQAALQRQQTSLVLEKARAHFDQGEYRQSLDLLETLQKDGPENIAARDLAAEARYRLALDHFDHQRFLEARDVLKKADESHEASMALKETVRARLLELAQIHYRNGVKHFINEDLKSAITDWEKALICNPDHEKARENIDNARRLMQKVETLP
ncbi:MAG: tetratricopeptide repeat protein [Deltaproteobacteria bacterium]|nr:tetratricopeptide repeat protein [Deltaproteobacteria bacterium]